MLKVLVNGRQLKSVVALSGLGIKSEQFQIAIAGPDEWKRLDGLLERNHLAEWSITLDHNKQRDVFSAVGWVSGVCVDRSILPGQREQKTFTIRLPSGMDWEGSVTSPSLFDKLLGRLRGIFA